MKTGRIWKFSFVALLIAGLQPAGIATAEVRKEHSAVKPVPREDQWWKARQADANEQVKKHDTELLFIGDSITQGWEGAGKEVWAKSYAKWHAVNLGFGGDRTQHVLWRLEHGNIDGIHPKAAVIMIGTNNSNGEDYTVTEVADGVTAIVHKLRKELPEMRILLLGIFPRGQEPNPQRGKVLQVNQIIKKLEDGKHVVFLDIGHHFINADGSISKDIMPDFLHLSPKGYEIWASAIEKRLDRLMNAK